MQLSQLCVSLELAKELKEAGYPQESLFYWVDAYLNYKVTGEAYNTATTTWVLRSRYNGMDNFPEDKIISAPTASELGEQLKNYHIEDSVISELPHYDIGLGMWTYRYIPDLLANTEADARAKMWLYLKQHQLLQGGR